MTRLSRPTTEVISDTWFGGKVSLSQRTCGFLCRSVTIGPNLLDSTKFILTLTRRGRVPPTPGELM